MIGKQETCFV